MDIEQCSIFAVLHALCPNLPVLQCAVALVWTMLHVKEGKQP